MTTTASKSLSPFQSKGWSYLEQLGESSFSSLPNFYEKDIASEPTTPTFRSVSSRIYNKQRDEYFEEMREELEFGDDCDSLYEATLMKAHFLEGKIETSANNNSSLARLRQILDHINPAYLSKPSSPLTGVLNTTSTSSIRSQFSASSSSLKPQQQQQPVPPMIAFAISDPRESKGKGKFKPAL